MFRSAITIGAGCIGAPLVMAIVRKMIVFRAPHLFYANRLLFGLYKQETEILLRKDDGNIKN
jgi:hypothetical protein